MLVTFSSTIWYRLHNKFLGKDVVLDVVNDKGEESSGALQMAEVGDYSGQYWQIRPHPDDDGTYILRTFFLGPDKTLAVNPSTLSAHLADTPDLSSAQKWKIVPWMYPSSGGSLGKSLRWDRTYKLINAEERWNGTEVKLDTFTGSKKLYVGTGDHQGKHWTITPLEKIHGRRDVEFLMGLGVDEVVNDELL